MNSETTLWVAIASGGFALLGALGSQIISALVNLKTKRLELVYARKVDGYKEFAKQAGIFWHDSKNTDKYAQFIHAYYSILIVASKDVLVALNEKGGVYDAACSLHTSQGNDEDSTVRYTPWSKAINRAGEAMRKDLQRFSKH